jgi:hypothetical protein
MASKRGLVVDQGVGVADQGVGVADQGVGVADQGVGVADQGVGAVVKADEDSVAPGSKRGKIGAPGGEQEPSDGGQGSPRATGRVPTFPSGLGRFTQLPAPRSAQELKSLYTTFSAAYRDMARTGVDLQRQLATLTEQQAQTSQFLQKAQEDASSLRQTVSIRETELSRLNTTQTETATLLADKMSKLETLTAQQAQTSQLLQQAQEDASLLRQEVAIRETELSKLNATQTETEQRLVDRINDLETLRKQQAKTDAALEDSKRSITEWQTAIAQLAKTTADNLAQSPAISAADVMYQELYLTNSPEEAGEFRKVLQNELGNAEKLQSALADGNMTGYIDAINRALEKISETDFALLSKIREVRDRIPEYAGDGSQTDLALYVANASDRFPDTDIRIIVRGLQAKNNDKRVQTFLKQLVSST